MSLFGKKMEPPKPEPPVVAGPRRVAPAKAAFGIDDAIRLFKTLPVEQNAALVVLVIKNTLASLQVDLGQVIADGSDKQERLRKRIAELRGAVAELERQADIHRAEIATVEVDLAETTSAKDRLETAQRGELPPPVAAPAPPARGRSVKPPSFPKPPPRTPSTEPVGTQARAAEPEPESIEPDEGPQSDLLAMLPDTAASDRET